MRTKNRINGSAVGVDGCQGGWFAVEINRDGGWSNGIYANIREIWQRQSQFPGPILIDIPIGLSENGSRTCDQLARKVLKKRASSVFPAPCRKALQAKNYRVASNINYQQTGKKLSVQTWNICARIREVDDFLTAVPQAQGRIRESHPEVSLWALAGARPMSFNKKTAAGLRERKLVLKKHLPQCEDIIKSAESTFARKFLAKDDIVDALALAVTALSSPEALVSLPPDPPLDEKQFCMEIVFTNQFIRHEK
jgi:predicted RNase H-like nuclease